MKKLFLIFGLLGLGQVCYAATVNDLTVMGRVITSRMDVSTMGYLAAIGFIDGSTLTTGNLASGGASSLAIGTGSIQAANIVSSPTAVINFDSATLTTKLTGGATAFVGINMSTFAQSFVRVEDWNIAKSTSNDKLGNLSASTNTLLTASATNFAVLADVKTSTNATRAEISANVSTAIGKSDFDVALTTNNTDHEKFKAWAATNSTVNDTQNSTMTKIANALGWDGFMSTTPYRTIPLPAGSWLGVTPSSASKLTGGFSMTSTATAYNNFGETYHLFDPPASTTSFVETSFRMPMEFDGSSIAFQLIWHSTGLSGTSIDKVIGWSLGGVAISSGTSIYTAITSSVTTFSAFTSTNTDIETEMSAGYLIPNARPGSRVKLALCAGGGGFTGLPRLVDVLIYYRQKYYDGGYR